CRARPVPRGRPVWSPLTTWQGFPCCCCFPLPCILSPIPRRNPRLLLARFIWDNGLPQFCAGSASALSFSRPARRSLTLQPARSPSPLKGPLHRRLQPFRCLHDCSDCYRLERPCRAGFATAGMQRLSTAHAKVLNCIMATTHSHLDFLFRPNSFIWTIIIAAQYL